MISFGRMKPFDDASKTGLWIRGHANYKKEGDDIVCAAVSAIGQTAAQGCRIYSDKTEIRHCKSGHIVFITEKSAETEAIIKSALLGLISVKGVYPQCFFLINVKKLAVEN